jgi:hypothetical protein
VYSKNEIQLLTDSAVETLLPPPLDPQRPAPKSLALPELLSGQSPLSLSFTFSRSFSICGPPENPPLGTCADWRNGKRRTGKDTISPDEEHLASTPNDGKVTLWRMKRLQLLVYHTVEWLKSVNSQSSVLLR